MEHYDFNSANVILTNSISAPINTPTTSEFTRTINLRQVIGPAYDEYDNFAICVNSISMMNFLSVLSIDGNPRSSSTPVLLGIKGLPFVRNRPINTTLALFPNYILATGNPTTTSTAGRVSNFSYPEQNPIIFKKPAQPIVDISVGFYSYSNAFATPVGFTNTSTDLSVNHVYCLTIFGIKIKKNLHKIK